MSEAKPLTLRHRAAFALARLIGGAELGERMETAVSAVVDDSSGWSPMSGRVHDRDMGEHDALYADALEAWRKNPIAWRIIQLTTDHVVGKTISISSPDEKMQKFIHLFWNHRKNRIAQRLETMSDELARSGDLIPLLHRNSVDGMSYLRFLTKDQILKIETRANDWEEELTIVQRPSGIDMEPRNWYTLENGRSKRGKAVALHYAINRPMGATFGEGDLTTAIPWLKKYSRLLEDRIRMHWALRAFFWIVTVPKDKVKSKQNDYANIPDAGAIIVKDDLETWEAVSPALRGSEAAPDMQAVRVMIDASSGFPPHWRGEPIGTNRATATAMQAPAERHLLRRQNYFVFILSDIIYTAYVRANQLFPEKWPLPKTAVYKDLFTAVTPDISPADNVQLAEAANSLANAYSKLGDATKSATLLEKFITVVMKFAGEPLDDATLATITKEIAAVSSTESEPPQRGGSTDD